MLLTALSVTKFGGSPVSLIGTGYRVRSLDWHPVMAGESTSKAHTSGRWPNWKKVDAMEIVMEAVIVGSDASDYWSKRETVMAAIVPANGVPAARYHSTVKATFSGVSEVYAQVTLLDLSPPIARQNLRQSDFQVTWNCDFGYWRKVSDDSVMIL